MGDTCRWPFISHIKDTAEFSSQEQKGKKKLMLKCPGLNREDPHEWEILKFVDMLDSRNVFGFNSFVNISLTLLLPLTTHNSFVFDISLMDLQFLDS